MKHLLTGIVLSLFAALSACNTFEGIGEDIEAAGEKIDREAEDKKNY